MNPIEKFNFPEIIKFKLNQNWNLKKILDSKQNLIESQTFKKLTLI